MMRIHGPGHLQASLLSHARYEFCFARSECSYRTGTSQKDCRADQRITKNGFHPDFILSVPAGGQDGIE